VAHEINVMFFWQLLTLCAWIHSARLILWGTPGTIGIGTAPAARVAACRCTYSIARRCHFARSRCAASFSTGEQPSVFGLATAGASRHHIMAPTLGKRGKKKEDNGSRGRRKGTDKDQREVEFDEVESGFNNPLAGLSLARQGSSTEPDDEQPPPLAPKPNQSGGEPAARDLSPPADTGPSSPLSPDVAPERQRRYSATVQARMDGAKWSSTGADGKSGAVDTSAAEGMRLAALSVPDEVERRADGTAPPGFFRLRGSDSLAFKETKTARESQDKAREEQEKDQGQTEEAQPQSSGLFCSLKFPCCWLSMARPPPPSEPTDGRFVDR
jgi:hypothetical protein